MNHQERIYDLISKAKTFHEINGTQSIDILSHTFKPVYNEESEILILGSFPSVKSRESNFYYGHPQNRFWKVIANILETEIPQTIEEKKMLLLSNKIAIWDVIASCTIEGSSDASIKNVVTNDFSGIIKNSKIINIFVNGTKAYELYRKYAEDKTGIKAVKLPSTSPANAAWNLERLCKEWKEKILIDPIKEKEKGINYE